MPIKKYYNSPADLPEVIPVFPLPEALLLPRGQMPLNIFEPRYLAMIDHALATDRLIGMVQPDIAESEQAGDPPALCTIGCCGRLTGYNETNDGRYLITLTGVCRFTIVEELEAVTPYRQCRIVADQWKDDFDAGKGQDAVDRKSLLATFRAFLEANDLDADWEGVNGASNESLVNALSMMSPYGAAEKQALLEAEDLKTRAETLIAITEIHLRRQGDNDQVLQ